MREKEKTKILIVILLFLLGDVQLWAANCHRLQSVSSGDLVSYLASTMPDYRNAECAAFAIDKLGTLRYQPAIPVLTKFLDFRWPRNVQKNLQAQQNDRAFEPSRGRPGTYPAISALEQYGQEALPALLQTITADSTSTTAREAAVFVLIKIYKDEPSKGVALLKEGADTTKDNATRQRLGRAAFRAVAWCGPSDKAQCEAVVHTRHSN